MPIGNVAVGRYEEASHPDSLKAALAEFIATLIFVFAGEGSVIAYGKLTDGASLSAGGLVGIALAHGMALFVAVAISANMSGGHVNPAVTFGLLVGGHISLIKTILYWIAQLLGALIACLLLKLVTHGAKTTPHTLASGEPVFAAIILEIVITFGLVYTVYASAADPKSKGNVGVLAPLLIGLIVAANILFAGAFDGGSMNPARSFGPAFTAWNWHHHWVYWVGPLLGAAIAGITYEVLFMGREPTHQPLPGDTY